MSRDEYENLHAMNWSSLKYLFSHCPAVFQHNLRHPDDQTAAMRSGSALHCMVLEPEEFDHQYAVGGPINSTTGKCFGGDSHKFKTWATEQLPKTSITDEDHLVNQRQYEYLHCDPYTKELLWTSPGKNEVILEGTIGGVKCKGLADRIIQYPDKNVLVDLKTTSVDMYPASLDREVANRLYHGQMGMYVELAGQMGIQIDEVVLAFAPKKEPWFPAVWRADRETIEEGLRIVEKTVSIYKECEAAGLWPGWNTSSQETRGIPVWAMPADG